MALGTQSVSYNFSRQRACSGYNSAHLEPSNENDSFIQMQNSPNASMEDVRAVSPPEPLGEKGESARRLPFRESILKPLCNLSNLRAKRQSGGSRR